MGDAGAAGCCWRSARSPRASPSSTSSSATATRSSGARRCSRAPATTSCMPCTRSRAGSAGRRSSPWLAASRSPTSTTSRRRALPRADGRASSSRSTCSCSTSGTSTSSTTGCSCGRRSGSAALLWKGGDGAIIDGLGPDGIAARVLWTTGRVVKLQTGYVYHYAFAMLIGVALIITCVHVLRRSGAMRHRLRRSSRSSPSSRWSARSLIAALNKEAKGNARWIALYTTLFTFGASLYIWAHFDPGDHRLPVRRGDGLARRLHQIQDGRRRHLRAVRGAHRVPDAAVHPRQLGVDRGARQGVHDRLPGAGDADDRRVLRARPGAVLPVLRGRPDPDVPDHRRVGRRAARLRQLQVLPLHAAGLGADAAGHDGHVLARRHHRHPDAAHPQVPRTTCSGGCGWRSSPRSP